MKHFAKSLVSLVIALTIFATMCVVGFSASAKVSEFVLVSATATKNKTDLTATKTGGVTVGTVDVVETSTLGTPPTGAPDTAYKFTIANKADGVHFTAPSDDASALGGKTTELVFDAWVYVSDVTKAGNLLFRMYGSAGPTLGGNGYVETYIWQGSVSGAAMSAKTGWNHIQVPMTFHNGWQAADGVAMTTYKADWKITGISLHDHSLASDNSYDVAVAAIKLFHKDISVDANEVGTTLVSAVDEKDVYNVKPITSANISVVDTADLTGGVSGVPSDQAYKSESDWKDGIVFPVDISNETAADIKANGAYLDAWVHITGATTANNFVFRFFKEGARNGVNGSLAQVNSQANGITEQGEWEAGWYHFVWQISAGTDLTGTVEMTAHDHGNIGDVSGMSSSFSVAAVRIVSTAADAAKPWDGREYLIGALSSQEAGITVGTWEAAEYEGGYGAFTTSEVVKFRKELPESHDLSGKLVVAWLYTSSTDINTGSCLELCTVNQDNREFTFYLKDLGLKVGWNKVIIDVNHKNGNGNPAGTIGYSGVNNTGGEPDASDINVIRIYEHNTSTVNFKVGAMYVADYGAVSNGTFYDTAEEAFDGAKANDTVTLHGDATVVSVMLNKGIDLELNGNTLTANYFVSFKGSEVADSSADKAGRLVVDSENLVLNAENAQLPVATEDGNGYAFFSVNMQQTEPVVTEDSVTLTFRPSIGSAFNAAWFGDGAADNGLKLGVRLTYTSQYAYDDGTATGTVSDTFVFDDAHVASVYTNNKALVITITGIAEVSDLTIASVVVSDLGLESVGTVVSVAAAE